MWQQNQKDEYDSWQPLVAVLEALRYTQRRGSVVGRKRQKRVLNNLQIYFEVVLTSMCSGAKKWTQVRWCCQEVYSGEGGIRLVFLFVYHKISMLTACGSHSLHSIAVCVCVCVCVFR